MPNTTSAKKALRQSVRRKVQNVIRKETYKEALKELRKLVLAKKYAEAKAALPKLTQALDKAAKSHVIDKNKASRLQARAARLLQKSEK